MKFFSTISVLISLLVSNFANAGIIYSENFEGHVGATQVEQFYNAGWFGGHTGDEAFVNRSNIVGEGAIGTDPFNNSFVYFSKKGIQADAYIYTNNFSSFLVGSIGFLTFNTFSSSSRQMELMLLIDDAIWLVASEGIRHTAGIKINQNQEINPFDYSYDSFSVSEKLPGPRDSSKTGVGLNDYLNGSVTALGFRISETLDGTIRFDNFKVSEVSAPVTLPLFVLGFSLLFFRSRTKKRGATALTSENAKQ